MSEKEQDSKCCGFAIRVNKIMGCCSGGCCSPDTGSSSPATKEESRNE